MSVDRVPRVVILVVLVLAASALSAVPAQAAPSRCGGLTATIIGTDGADWLLGTSGPDVIVGGEGDDHIVGLGGDDVICGGKGEDFLHGSAGDDTVLGGPGHDRLQGGGGRDHLEGGPGHDTASGGRGRDVVWGQSGQDACWGERLRCEHKMRTTHRQPDRTGLVFTWRTVPVDSRNRQRVASTWRPECPVRLDDLVLLQLDHDRGATAARGELVVHRAHADDLVAVFGTLFDADFPVARMDVIDEFGGDDTASMRANNTSAFNCRAVAGTSTWSEHASGAAVDINPFVNPYVRGSTVDPPEGAAYVVRDPSVPGLIVDGDVVTTAFGAIGWGWGGNWSSVKDYQHFSATNR